MGKEERIIFALGFISLVAIMIFHRGGNNAPMLGNAPTKPPPTTTAPVDYSTNNVNYLTYNQPWLMAPPVGNVLPQIASGQLGQTFTEPDLTGNNIDCMC
jgi:hypothetical protein